MSIDLPCLRWDLSWVDWWPSSGHPQFWYCQVHFAVELQAYSLFTATSESNLVAIFLHRLYRFRNQALSFCSSGIRFDWDWCAIGNSSVVWTCRTYWDVFMAQAGHSLSLRLPLAYLVSRSRFSWYSNSYGLASALNWSQHSQSSTLCNSNNCLLIMASECQPD